MSPICTIIPPHILTGIADSSDASEESRVCCSQTLQMTEQIRDARAQVASDISAHSHGAAPPPQQHQGIIPPHITGAVSRHAAHTAGEEDETHHDSFFRAWRKKTKKPKTTPGDTEPTEPRDHNLNRSIYTMNHSEDYDALPGKIIIKEGGPPIGASDSSGDPDECYNFFQNTYDFYYEVFNRDSIDGKALPLVGSVHFGKKYQNAFWDGKQMVFGDGDGIIFNGFTDELDVIGHELTHGVTAYTANLDYNGQSGALNESVSDVFGIMIKQWVLKQTAEEANWLIGEGIFTKAISGEALRSMKAPGTAYNDPQLGGRDPQPDHMKNYKRMTQDNGGVHINSGIPNKAFYLLATKLGGSSWERAGPVWYRTLTGGKLKSSAQFQDFADLTLESAKELFPDDDTVANAVTEAWSEVGLSVGGSSTTTDTTGADPSGNVGMGGLYRG